MKTKGFTLIEMIIAMSLMGLVLVGGGKLYHHLSGMVLTYQSQQESSLQRLQGQRILQQDLLESIAIQGMTDSTFCLKKHAFEEAVCYVRKDGFWVRGTINTPSSETAPSGLARGRLSRVPDGVQKGILFLYSPR